MNLDEIKAGNRLSRPEKCPSRIYNLMLQCWDIDPERRPTFSDISEFIMNFFDRLDPNPFANKLSTSSQRNSGNASNNF